MSLLSRGQLLAAARRLSQAGASTSAAAPIAAAAAREAPPSAFAAAAAAPAAAAAAAAREAPPSAFATAAAFSAPPHQPPRLPPPLHLPPPHQPPQQHLQPQPPSSPALDTLAALDTLDMLKHFERAGLSRGHAEAMTEYMARLILSSQARLAAAYVARPDAEKASLEMEARQASFRAEVLKSQELQAVAFTRDAERLQGNLEKVRSEVRYEVDKLTASQRLDLNLEKGRMRDELQALRDREAELDSKLDREVNALRAAQEQSKNEVVKYVLGLVLALMTAGLGAARLMM